MLQRRRSPIQGWGVFATTPISKNTRVIHYAGEKISNQVSLKRERRYSKSGHIWCFKLTNRTVIDAHVGGNIARYINHACTPNCYIEVANGVIWIRAARNILKGEELTYHYNTDGEGLHPVPVPGDVPDDPVTPRRVLYLHGFASSAASTKAQYFGERLRDCGVLVRCPDFNQPAFSTLTITRMLNRLAAELTSFGGEPVTLIESSLGGTLAILAAARLGARVDRLVLLAPAVMFAKPGHHLLPPERVEEWRRTGALPFFHYGDQTERRLNFSFYEDSLRYNAFDTVFSQPTIIFQGLHDASVDHRTVEQFARARPHVKLVLLADDHQLIASLPRMWTETAAFLGFE